VVVEVVAAAAKAIKIKVKVIPQRAEVAQGVRGR